MNVMEFSFCSFSLQTHFVPSQHVQQQQHQQIPLSRPNIYTNHPQMSSQVREHREASIALELLIGKTLIFAT